MSKLTNRTRYRRSIFGKMILQVEVSVRYSPSHYNVFNDEETHTYWRDAKWDEVSLVNKGN